MYLCLMFICRASGILGADDPFGDVCNSVFSFFVYFLPIFRAGLRNGRLR